MPRNGGSNSGRSKNQPNVFSASADELSGLRNLPLSSSFPAARVSIASTFSAGTPSRNTGCFTVSVDRGEDYPESRSCRDRHTLATSSDRQSSAVETTDRFSERMTLFIHQFAEWAADIRHVSLEPLQAQRDKGDCTIAVHDLGK